MSGTFKKGNCKRWDGGSIYLYIYRMKRLHFYLTPGGVCTKIYSHYSLYTLLAQPQTCFYASSKGVCAIYVNHNM